MTKPHVIVLSITHQGLTKQQAAHKFNVSIRWINKLLARYKQEGLDGLEPKSRRPRSSPTKSDQTVSDLILEIRYHLIAQGMDAGPRSIAWQISNQDLTPPSNATIWRILKTAGAITPQPRKRPRNSYIRFQAEQPNETWQSDFTHWRLADGTDVEILNFLDDHSRFLLGCQVFKPVTSQAVIGLFLDCVSSFGPPQSTLTDNGLVFTSRFIGGKSPFEYTLANLGIRQKNGSPGHPQTQGKIERFHQTLKKFLAQMPRVQTLDQLQLQLNEFKRRYNTERPHSSLGQKTPQTVFQATIKAKPSGNSFDAHRVRRDRVDSAGKVSLRRAGTMHKLGIGRPHAAKQVLILVHEKEVLVTDLFTGEVLSEHVINPEKKYWPKATNPGD